MKNFKMISAVFFISLMFTAQAKDVAQLDVAGVKLGMSPKEVVAALKAKYKVKDSQIQRMKFGGSPYIKGNFISTILLRQANTKVRVAFGVVPPVNKSKPIQVENIEYSVSSTIENLQNLKKAAIAKYGKPSVKRKHTGVLEWCQRVEEVGGVFGTTQGCSGSKPFLRLRDTTLQLFDPTRNMARDYYKLKGMLAIPKL